MSGGKAAPKAPRRASGEEGVHVAPLVQLRNLINSDFEKFISRFGSPGTAAPASQLPAFLPNANIMQSDKTIHVEIELPGMTEKDVEVAIAENVLTIQGERRQAQERRLAHSYRREFAYGAFRRSLTLPANIVADRARATVKNGMLVIDLPISAKKQSQARKIRVAAD